MANFAKPLQEATDKELEQWIDQLNFQVVPLASDELTRRELRKLSAIIEEAGEQSKKLEKSNYKLQVSMLILTFISTSIVLIPIVKVLLNLLNLKYFYLASDYINFIATILSVFTAPFVGYLMGYGLKKKIKG